MKSITISILCSFLIAGFLNYLSAQEKTCSPLGISSLGEEIVVALNPDSVLVRMDKTPKEFSTRVGCFQVSRPGFYKLKAGVVYSGGKTNEIFYFDVGQGDTTRIFACDANAGPFKVVNIVRDIPNVEANVIREAGVFFLEAGDHNINLNHYALIAEDYPGFWTDDTVAADSPESVHLYELRLRLVGDISYDLLVHQNAIVDTVEQGELIDFDLSIVNSGPGAAYDLTFINTIPIQVSQAALTFSKTPNSFYIEDNQHYFLWNIDSLLANQSITLRMSIDTDSVMLVNDSLSIKSYSRISSVCDEVEGNNSDSAVVFVLNENDRQADIAISQTVVSDSFHVENGDTTWFADPGEKYSYYFKISNLSATSAKGLAVEQVLPDSTYLPDKPDARIISLNIAEIAPMADTTLRLDVKVAEQMPEGLNFLINKAFVTQQRQGGKFLQSNVVTDTVHNIYTRKWVDLAIEQHVVADSFVIVAGDTFAYIDAGDEFKYEVRLRTEGNIVAQDVLIENQLPLDVISIESQNNRVMSVDLAALPPGTDTTVVFSVMVVPEIAYGRNELVNFVSVYSPSEETGLRVNNTASDTVMNERRLQPPQLSDMTISATMRADSIFTVGNDTTWYARGGTRVLHEITVTNLSDAEAADVLVFNILADSLHAQGKVGGDTLFWEIGNVPAFSQKQIAFESTVSTAIPEDTRVPLVNLGYVSASNEDSQLLFNNNIISNQMVIAIPVLLYKEACELFIFSQNVFKPAQQGRLSVQFNVNTTRSARIDIYDMSGLHILKLSERVFREGTNELFWDGKTSNGLKAGSGVYVIVLKSGELSCWKKVIIAR